MNRRKFAVWPGAAMLVVASIAVLPVAAFAGNGPTHLLSGADLAKDLRYGRPCDPGVVCSRGTNNPDVRDHRGSTQPDCKGGHTGANGVTVSCK